MRNFIYLSKFTAMYFFGALVASSLTLSSAFAADSSTQVLCINNTSGAVTAKAKCKRSKETRFSEKSYSQGRTDILYVAPGGAKYSTIESAISAATLLFPTAAEPVLIKVAPGTYTVTEQLELPSNVSLEGSGVDTTIISSNAIAVFMLASNSTLRDLTLSSTSSDTHAFFSATALEEESRIQNVKVVYNGSPSSFQAFVGETSTVTLDNVQFDLTGPSGAVMSAMTVRSGTVVANRVTSSITNGSPWSIQVSSGSLKLTNSEITSTTSTGSDTGLAIRVSESDGSLYAENLKVRVSESNSGAAEIVDVTDATNVVIKNSYLEQVGFANSAVSVSGTGVLKIYNSVIIAESPNPTVATFDTGTISAFGTQLSGGAVNPSGGAITCAAVTDESFTFSASSCP